MPGEAMHQRGAEGARRAKRWLDKTTRTKASWTNEDEVTAGRMEFTWPAGGCNPFSFDVGGILTGVPFENHNFLAEVKNYTTGDLGRDYDDFVAKCYIVRRDHRRIADQFMFLTWHPFRVTNWKHLDSPEAVVLGLAGNHARAFPVDADPGGPPCFPDRALSWADRDILQPCRHMNADLINDLAPRLWPIVLSEKQEELVISDDDRALIIAERVKGGRL